MAPHGVCRLLSPLARAGVMHNLSVVNSDAEQLSAMVHAALLEPFWVAAHASDAGFRFEARPWLSQPMLFWKEGLKILCHRMGSGLIKESAVMELLMRLRRCARGHAAALACVTPHAAVALSAPRRPQLRDGWIPLKRENRAYLEGTRVVRPCS